MSEILGYLMVPFLQPQILLALAAGTCAGVYVGAIPGLTGTMAISLLISVTYGWNTNIAIAAMIGIYIGAVYGGSRSAILLNIPGAPAAVATVFDGYPLAKRGLAAKAIGVSTTQSVVGGLIGSVFLLVFTPAISSFSVNFGPLDYFLLGFMGMLMVGALGNSTITKGLMAAGLGILIGRVGLDSISGVPRFTFGFSSLMAGVPNVVAMIGLYGFAEALLQVSKGDQPMVRQNVDKIIPEFGLVKRHFWLTLRCSIIGPIIGALPGAGGSVAAFLAYDHAKQTVKNPEVPFGEGAIEGVIAPESANNAAVGGALVPMLTLGVPGDGVTAILLGALTMHGLTAGPTLLSTNEDFFYLIVALSFIGNIFLLFFGLTGIKIFAKFVEIPKGRLFPIIVILTVVGAFSTNNLLTHVGFMMFFGIVGYILKKYGYPASPMVLGIVLGNLLEKNLRNALVVYRGFGGCIQAIFTRPITFVLFLIIVVTILMKQKWFNNWIKKILASGKGKN